MLLKQTSITGISLDAAGLVALADLSSISERTALKGSASLLDVFFLAPGIHTQQDASDVNGGELPMTGAMTSGYVFRVENQATVNYLQKVGQLGCLVTLHVEPQRRRKARLRLLKPQVWLYLIGIGLTLATLSVLVAISDYWAFGVLLMLAFARFLNTIVIKRRAQMRWKGALEPGIKGDLLVLLSQDRWIRIKGMVDDLKAVTAGQWLRDQTPVEHFATGFAKLLVYGAAALATNASTIGSLFIACLLLVSVALLGLCNTLTKDLWMYGRRVHVVGELRRYERRLDMAKDLIAETDRDDWAIAMGLVLPAKGAPPEPAQGLQPPITSMSIRPVANEDLTSRKSVEDHSSVQVITVIDNAEPFAARDEDRKTISRRPREKARNKAISEGRATTKPPRRFTISVPDDEETEVPMQRAHAGTRVISSSLASTSCASLGISKLLEGLNDVLGTTYILDDSLLASQLNTCIVHEYDFGIAYGRLRPRWSWRDRAAAVQDMAECETEDRELRRAAVNSENKITNPLIPPRRVWDLYSNRVLPSWIVKQPIAAVSHAWVSPEARQNVDTAINSYEWPVSIPIGTTLERVRIELLNQGLQYVWLDVLCLRKEGHQVNESLRSEEWAIDVPTIGNVYHQNQQVVHYYSGLGLPFRIGNLDSDRHWINRAWTMQEISVNSTIAGVTPDSPISPEFDEESGQYLDSEVGRFYEALGTMATYSQNVDNIYPLLSAMRRRSAVSELDKIAGLAYLLRSKVLPAYRGDLLFQFPVPGDGRHGWRPSWQQVIQLTLPKYGYLFEEVKYVEQDDTYFHTGYRLDHCRVVGLGEFGDGSEHRTGTVRIAENTSLESELLVFAFHSHPIPDGYYTLIGSKGRDYWVVGRINSSGRVEKISVIRIGVDVETDRKIQRWDISKVESEYV